MMSPELWAKIKAAAEQQGYRFEFEESATHIVQRMIRPDGTVAVQAIRKLQNGALEETYWNPDERQQ